MANKTFYEQSCKIDQTGNKYPIKMKFMFAAYSLVRVFTALKLSGEEPLPSCPTGYGTSLLYGQYQACFSIKRITSK